MADQGSLDLLRLLGAAASRRRAALASFAFGLSYLVVGFYVMGASVFLIPHAPAPVLLGGVRAVVGFGGLALVLAAIPRLSFLTEAP